MDPSSCTCLKFELDFFKTIPTQLSIENSTPSILFPIASISNQTSPIEFLIFGSGESLIDLSSISINAQLSVTKRNGMATLDTDLVTPVNNLLHSMFSRCTTLFNDKLVSTHINYPYKAIIDALLFSSEEAQKTYLTSSFFYKDTAGFLNETDPIKDVDEADPIKDAKNEGLIARFKKSRQSQVLDLYGRLHFDFINQPKLLINGVDVRIKLERSKDAFALMANSDNYQIRLKNIMLKVNRIEVSPSILLGMEKTLENSVIKMPYRRVNIKVFTLSKGILSSNISNAIIGQIPKRIIIGLVRNNAFNGQIDLNPFNFENFDLNYISVIKDSILIPPNPYTPDFDEKSYARSYATLFEEMGGIPYGKYANISYSDYAQGYMFHVFDLTPDKAASENHTSIITHGNISIDLKFKRPLPETINVVCYLEYRNTIEIDRSRNIFIDY
ncbi:uncharacterized protein LOC111631979 [Centruroides sculpturatus]|uniref:uncharacterized protein LOC111631979 n=1 Tax=Centruroides sculpturatus TaxID=218467 RepID=UPI000C6E124F|nr:uncharacterized protein LOC111631979 [Centruroides sculpturatus]